MYVAKYMPTIGDTCCPMLSFCICKSTRRHVPERIDREQFQSAIFVCTIRVRLSFGLLPKSVKTILYTAHRTVILLVLNGCEICSGVVREQNAEEDTSV